MAWIIPAVTALYGAYEGHQQASAQRDAARRAGQPQTTTTSSEPWGPTIPMRQEGLNAAMDLFRNYTPQFNPYRPGGGGPSAQTRSMADLLFNRANGTQLLGDTEGFLSNVLGGLNMSSGPRGLNDADIKALNAKRFLGNSVGANKFAQANPNSALGKKYLELQNSAPAGTIDAAGSYNPMLMQLWNQGAPQNQYLSSFLERYINDPAFIGQDDGSGSSSSGPELPVGMLSSEGYLNKVLGGEYLNQGNPYADALIDNISRKVRENYLTDAVPSVDSAANSRGRFGSGIWSDLRAKEDQNFQQTLGDLSTNVLFDQYTFERGQQGDASRTLAGLDVAKMNEEGSRFNSDRAFNSQESSQHLAALLDAMGMYGQNQQFGSGYLGSLAQQYSNDLMSAAGLAPGVNQAGLSNIQAGMQASGQLDAARNAATQRQRAYDIAKWNFEQELPFNQLSNMGRFIDMFGGGFGTGQGTGPGQVIPYGGPSQAGAILGGALQGWQTGTDIYGLWNQYRGQQGSGTSVPPASRTTDPWRQGW